jgi:hypothetical protein
MHFTYTNLGIFHNSGTVCPNDLKFGMEVLFDKANLPQKFQPGPTAGLPEILKKP